MTDHDFIKNYLEDLSLKLKPNKEIIEKLILVRDLLIKTSKKNKKILIFGNGGSAAIASHFSVDLTKNAKLRCLCFSDADHITCFANDYGFEHIFSRQIEALGRENDCVVGISTSGMSINILNGINSAKRKGIKTIGLLGKGGGGVQEICDLSIVVDSNSTARIQEVHITLGHILCDLIEKKLKLNS